MKRAIAIALTSGAMFAAAGGAQADWSIGGGFENFRWKETTTPTVKESGLRWALDLTWAQTKEPGLSAEYNLKFYFGKVDYDGAFLMTGIPVSSETKYRGYTNEIRSVYRAPQSTVDFILAAGWDHWSRKLSVAQQEEYDILYARLGAAMGANVKQGFIGTLGVKYPFYTRENAHLGDFGFTTNPRLRPGKGVSLYGSLGYRVNSQWDVLGYYDSYRFKESNGVAVTDGTGATFIFFQPESKQDQIGMKVQFNF